MEKHIPSPHTPGGRLVLAANSLGNSEDVPERAKKLLQNADLLVFEEDRVARQTLKAAGIHRQYSRLSEHHEADTLAEVRTALKAGKTVSYMSDQGMPGVADPGWELVALAYQVLAKVEIIPGPSSITTALAACPFKVERFLYYGFLSREPQNRKKELSDLGRSRVPAIILDTPYRLKAVLDECSAVIPTCKALLAIDISGPLENYYYEPLSQLATRVATWDGKVNFVLVINFGH